MRREQAPHAGSARQRASYGGVRPGEAVGASACGAKPLASLSGRSGNAVAATRMQREQAPYAGSARQRASYCYVHPGEAAGAPACGAKSRSAALLVETEGAQARIHHGAATAHGRNLFPGKQDRAGCSRGDVLDRSCRRNACKRDAARVGQR
jgi:hypothetical protein